MAYQGVVLRVSILLVNTKFVRVIDILSIFQEGTLPIFKNPQIQQ